MKNNSDRKGTGKNYLLLFHKFLLIWVFLSAQICALAQVRTISGTVRDADNNPLPGVSIAVKGTTVGTTSDVDGKYTLSIPANAQTLVFSFIGMQTKEVEIGSGNTYDVALTGSTIGLEEVVVIGYGTQKKSDLTGSIVRVNMDDKAAVSNVTVGSALQGVTAGVNVGAAANAGDAPDLSIRGKTSLSASDAPLIVLNGIIFNGSISDININDVESIDILKDASAAAVYGARSANGVMIITTKKGTSETPVFNVNAYYGFQDFTNSPKRPMNGDEFAIRLVDFYYQQSLYNWYAKRPTSESDFGGKPVRGDINDRDYVATATA
jgi:TonB-dependent SusC/RagA subfamily outer membrane receptor